MMSEYNSSYIKIEAGKVIAACEKEIQRLEEIVNKNKKEVLERREIWISIQLNKKKFFTRQPKWTREALEKWLEENVFLSYRSHARELHLDPSYFDWYREDKENLRRFISIAKQSVDGYVLLSTYHGKMLRL